MAAGLGTRLLPLTELTAKPMVPILNRPVMEHILRLLAGHGVREVAANLHYHPDLIRSTSATAAGTVVQMRYLSERRLARHGRRCRLRFASSSATARSSSSAAMRSPTSI